MSYFTKYLSDYLPKPLTVFLFSAKNFKNFDDNMILLADKAFLVNICPPCSLQGPEKLKMSEEINYGPVLLEATIREEWIDFNGHMNMAYYVLLFDQALTNFLESHDLGLAYVRDSGKSLFALENHVTYQHELKQGEPIRVHFQLLDVDSKFIHYFMRLFHRDMATASATMEQISLHVNMANRMPARFGEKDMARLLDTLDRHREIGRPREMGRSIAIRRHSPAKIKKSASNTGQPVTSAGAIIRRYPK